MVIDWILVNSLSRGGIVLVAHFSMHLAAAR